ncbi:helicase with zinc finger domain 2-like [Strongylocentrotus purpuratus]|uniref:DNA2/NAM7 helicase-like C-terminal domain-containing protein n=1 Tax=Strongylocentrotus purpuratus TaxID=7668 RepID=A0A7M7SXA7_STRPU|nr:helicase with zinc finger domain 2-like [Strongylocentrotus purpuratus]
MSEGLSDIALHRLIRKHGKPYAKLLAAYEEKFRTDPGTILPTEIRLYKSKIFEATVIIDEAGMCTEPETLIPLVSVQPEQVVLIGDHQQLRPIITEPIAKQLGMDISLLEKYKEKAEMLTTQHRMHHRICEFPSSAFYNGKLRTAESVMRRGPDPIYSIWPNNGETPTVFCHVDGREDRLSVKSGEGNEGSKSNGAEIGYVIRIVQGMISKGVSPEKIIVLSQYNLQCAQIAERLKKNSSLRKIKVSTVVKSQGSEADYVIFSTVRSKPRNEIDEKPSKGWQKRHLGLINDENQMNVALTRAKRGLIIVGKL